MKVKKKKTSKIKNKSVKKLDPNQINIISEKKVPYVDLEVDMGSNVHAMLLQYAKENILKDEQALINWAFIDALTKGLDLADKKAINNSDD